jgi:squalene-hopene/tetraprenyl-beta-curcumene cyclase
MTVQAQSTLDAAGAALDRAVAWLREHQTADGWWKGNMETNVTMDAEDLLMRQFLGIRTAEQTAASARWIRSKQRDDGTWATFHGGPADLSTTVEAYLALKLAGDDVDAPHMVTARRYVLSHGGLESTRVFTRIWLALFGEWPWQLVPVIPPEIVFLPPSAPLSLYSFGCWARQTVVPIAVLRALQPRRRLGVSLAELRAGSPPPTPPRALTVPGLFHLLDRQVLIGYERHPIRPLRRLALARCAEWMIARQEADGGWGGIQPPWAYGLMALDALGYPLDHPVQRAALSGLDGFTVHEDSPTGTLRWMEACQSPVWDTCLAVTALADAGVAADDPALTKAGRWLVGEEIRRTGDWAVRRPGLAPSGWAFEFANDGYPDTDDTAEVILALRRIRSGAADARERRATIGRAVRWLAGMQSSDGGWGAFDADNTSSIPAQIPFADFGAMTDPPSADVTAHVVECLCAEGMADDPVVRRGVDWLLRHQEDDGSWYGRWGANHVYGTGAVVPALVAAGYTPDDPRIRRAVRWLSAHQNPDGGWGEDLRSYRDDGWRGRGESTPSQTAWALLALDAAGAGASAEARRGAGYLAQTQNPDGSWDEDHFTGTGFPGDFYLSYKLYRMVFPVSALGRILGRVTPAPTDDGTRAVR